jgi:hypothetical protein
MLRLDRILIRTWACEAAAVVGRSVLGNPSLLQRLRR